MSRFKGFTRIAASFDPIEIRLAFTALDGAGFTTITPNLRITETLPMNPLLHRRAERREPFDE